MLSDLAYRAAVRGVRLLSPFFARGSSKLARGVRGRRRAVERIETWARSHRREGVPLLWLHAPSVGEGLQARAVWRALRTRGGPLQCLFTHFSPSAESLAGLFGADIDSYLPWDLPADMGRTLDAVRPSAVVFTQTEVWPVLAHEARRRGIPTALVAGTLAPGAGRLSRVARAVLRPAFAGLDTVHAVAADDGRRFQELGVAEASVVVTGDPGIDSAADRASSADPTADHLRPFHAAARRRVVAGSTWPSDESVLLAAWRRIRAAAGDVQLVIVPHEPTEDATRTLLGRLEREGCSVATLSDVEAAGDADNLDAVVVERVGVLADLYTVANVAFVGGGFHRSGLHSVLEPAAARVPVLFGPLYEGSRAAVDLLRAGGARCATDAAELAEAIGEWLRDSTARTRAGEAASAYVSTHRDAAGRSADLLLGLLEPAVGSDPSPGTTTSPAPRT